MYQNEKWAKWVLASPLLLFLLVLVVFPAFYGIYTSTQNMTLGLPDSTFVGIDNYLKVLKDDTFWQSMWFTVRFTVMTTLVELILGFGLALLFDRIFPGKRLLLSFILIPIMVAPSLMGIMLRLILNENIGVATYFFSKIGLDINLFDPSTIVPLLVVLDIIQWVPFTFLILYSGLQTVDHGLYEAAAIDGASYWKTIRKVIIPVVSPILFIASFLRGIDAFRTFDVIYVLTNGGPGNSTTTASIFIYKTAFKDGNIGEASAASMLIALMLLVLLSFLLKRIGTKQD
ncbi:sugar ABC transporter permease [Neobacillus sp.]|uniref:carbohydrate ABC transporter permease n=1 Tax=Neobacillus sp. TaxID=2675273 RepID=UPI002896E164|nr:sugar ABC transporter permease [Neobacillus sp.]